MIEFAVLYLFASFLMAGAACAGRNRYQRSKP